MSGNWTISIKVDGKVLRLPSRAVALTIGVSHEELIAELKRNGGDMSKVPEDWKRQTRRRGAETAAKLGDDSVMGVLRHYAKEEQ